MHRTSVVIIGAGQAGLAVSYLLTAASVDHVVLERGRTAESWRSRRWDSLRLLTPNWMSRLPGWSYGGRDPAGFMPAGSVAEHLTRYADSFAAPVVPGADVRSVRWRDGGYLVVSDAGCWTAKSVVIATGYCDEPAVPRIAGELHPTIVQLTPDRYRNPDNVPDGGVLVVGASATGVQLADELAGAGRDVVLAVGLDAEIDPATRPAPSVPLRRPFPAARLGLRANGIRSVIWATGYRRRYPWLHLPVLDASGEIRHKAGRTPAAGLVVVGMSGQTRRNSTFLDGVRHDAALVVDHLTNEVLAGPGIGRRAS